ncbi:Hint domain-containing protein [Tateyamaria sp. ANG-S1]|uniref:Hint domain-containing protein n=1 Tax=Tateyamaria sp. ANG-S1 TaxID=1577905 RepID=UPI0006898AA7|nr:Hint domain-containing protein [Tateyamaria sp. ANG-S1]
MPLYTLRWVYQLNDFDTTGGNITPPNEQGARAAGSAPFNIRLDPAAQPIQIVIDDDDADFNEAPTDTNQVLANDVTIDGVTYPAGSLVTINYVLTDDNGFEGFSITIGQNNNGNNTTTAFISNQPMVPGQQYIFTQEDNIGRNPRPYSEFVCFTAGTRIRVPGGTSFVEDLKPGDLVTTMDFGPQPIRWVGSRTVPGIGARAPVTIAAGTLGARRDLTVSPNHRILIDDPATELMTGEPSLLVAAKHLVNGQTIRTTPRGFVTYVHIMFDAHQVIWANGCASESFYLGEYAQRTLDTDQARELLALFPELAPDTGWNADMAYPVATSHEGRVLATYI